LDEVEEIADGVAGTDLRAAHFKVMHVLAVRDDEQDGQGVPTG
jgi:hypothetical protein